MGDPEMHDPQMGDPETRDHAGTAFAPLAISGGRIYTMDGRRPVVEALLVCHGRIDFLGSAAEVHRRAAAVPGCVALDLAGGCAVPGFTDSHIHFLSYGLNFTRVALTGVASFTTVLERVAAAARDSAPGAWVEGWGWDHSLWPGATFPDRSALDRVAPDVPVALQRKDGHMTWLNTAALAAAGIDRQTPDPEGGRIGRDAFGEPTGLLFERAHDLVQRVLPPPTPAQAEGAARRAMAELHRLGVTGIHVPEGALTYGTLQRLDATGELRLRTVAMLAHETLDAALAVGLRTGTGSDCLRVGPVKLFMDGSLGSETAAMLAPFESSTEGSTAAAAENRGLLTLGIDEARRAIARAATGGIASAIHAIGDRANRLVLDAFEATAGAWRPAGLRQRIEHVQVLHPDDLPRLAALGVIASVQPIHATQDIDLVDRLWGQRGRLAYAFRSLLSSGATLAFGSDAPVESPDPLAGLYAAVARRRPDGRPAGGWYPQERISMVEAVHGYTVGAAAAAGWPGHDGRLLTGAPADLALLSQDIFHGPPERLLETHVRHTVFAGQVVYSAAP